MDPHAQHVLPHSDQVALDRAEKVLGRYLELALLAESTAGIHYAEEALDGIRGVRTLYRAGLLDAPRQKEDRAA